MAVNTGENLIGIIIPICRNMQQSAQFERISQYVEKFIIEKTPLMVAFFGPGVREIHQDPIN